MTTEELNTLREEIDTALDDEDCRKGGMGHAVNWGDLYCTDLREWRDHRGNQGITAIIEEADPCACGYFYKYLNERLSRYGQLIEVWTQW